jgi:8-oxo-dGTP diphosphatase
LSQGASLVVAAAIRRGGLVLAAQRAHPPALAGQWEFPGGAVEPGETPEQAIVRECREELGALVVPQARLGAPMPLGHGRQLRLYACALAGPEPTAQEHAGLRWISAAQLGELPWLAADLALLPAVSRWLIR